MESCIKCGSMKIIRYGTKHGKQQWKCKECGRYWFNGLPKEHIDYPIVYDFSLGYVVGVLLGDGSLSKCKDYYYFDDKYKHVKKAEATRIKPRILYMFQLMVKDRDFAEEFAKQLSLVTHRKPTLYEITSNKMTTINMHPVPYVFHGHKVQLKAKEWYFKIKPLCETLDWLENSNIDVVRGFLRGLFDSEAHVRKTQYGIQIIVTNKKIELLQLANKMLKLFDIKPHVHPKSRSNLYILSICNKEGVSLYMEKIGFAIKRKQLIKCLQVS